MSGKQGLKTFSDLTAYARSRAAISLKRNDPIAHAYWRETEIWSERAQAAVAGPIDWVALAQDFARQAQNPTKSPMEAALCYSRAKWATILGRNNGLTMNPKETGVNLDWLRKRSA